MCHTKSRDLFYGAHYRNVAYNCSVTFAVNADGGIDMGAKVLMTVVPLVQLSTRNIIARRIFREAIFFAILDTFWARERFAVLSNNDVTALNHRLLCCC